MRAAAIVLMIATALCVHIGVAQAEPLTAQERARVDAIVADVLADTQAPSVSLAIVRGGELAYVQAYGMARERPRVRATTETRYAIGSVSKQFTAAAILSLQEQGRLATADPVGRYVSRLTRGEDISIAQVLSHTAGYRDYWPQDFVFPQMAAPAGREDVLDGWARIPLDFEPGTDFRYSNTGFTIAGLIVEQVSGERLHDFLQARVFSRLGMTGVSEIDNGPLPAPHAQGFTRFGLDRVTVAPKEGAGWLFAIGELAMRPTDLALWNIALMEERALSPASVREMTTPVPLASGAGRYGLGLFVTAQDGRRVWAHGGAVSGYLAENVVYPDEGLAITVLSNGDFADATGPVAQRLAFMLREQPARIALIRDTLAELQAGRIDRSRFTEVGSAYFSETALAAFSRSLRRLGPAQLITGGARGLRGGLSVEVYDVTFTDRRARIVVRAVPDGAMEQFMISFLD